MNSQTSPQARVERGVGHLDETEPGWLNCMPADLSRLNINDDDRCVCGHIYGHGYESLSMAGIYSEARAQHYGFMALSFLRHPVAFFGDSRRLTAAWRRKITALRAGQGAGEGT